MLQSGASPEYNPHALSILRKLGLFNPLSASPGDRTNFIYKLGGNPSEIDVFALAPTLLALGELIQEGNRTLYPEGKQIAVNVKPFKEGSFWVDVVLFPTEAIYPIFALAKEVPPQQILEVLGFIGIVKGTGVVAKTANSVLDVIKKLRGKPQKVEQLKPGQYRYTSGDKSITVDGNVHQLIQNNNVTVNLYKAYAKPLEDTEFDHVQSYLEDNQAETKAQVTREDVPALKEFSSIGTAEEQINERIHRDVPLNPKRGAFEGDGSQWSFHRGDTVITATIRDQEFLAKVENGEIRPNHSDLMVVVLKETQKVAGTKVRTPRYEILEVTEYRVGPKQMRISLTSGEQRAIESRDPKALPPAPDSDSTE